jgi:Domain of unknown function (DUF4194)
MITYTKILPYAPVFVRMLKGPVEYLDKSVWERLLQYKKEFAAFLLPLGLALVLDEQDGYAYIRHAAAEDEGDEISWVQRRSYTYEESILLVLLREMMAEFEVGDSGSRELVRKRREIKEYAELFFREKASRMKFLREMDRLIDKMAELGFLHLAEPHEVPDEERFRIRKIIKAKVDSEVLQQFLDQLQQHRSE